MSTSAKQRGSLTHFDGDRLGKVFLLGWGDTPTMAPSLSTERIGLLELFSHTFELTRLVSNPES